MSENDNNNNFEYSTKYDLNIVDKRLSAEIKENRDKTDANAHMIAKLEAVYSSLEGLPLTITNLDKTITIIGSNLTSMGKNLEDVKESVTQQNSAIKALQKENTLQNDNISKIDNKSKIDWAVFISNNFWKILSVAGIIYIAIRLILDGRGG